MNKYLQEDEDDSSSDEDYNIHEVVRTANLAEVKATIAKDRPRLVALKDKEGRIPLHHAVQLNRERVALFLIAKHSDINARDNAERTPLHLAAAEGLTEMCRFLLDFVAKLKVKDVDGWTALHHAVKQRHIDTAALLIKRGSSLQVEDFQHGRTPLHLAAQQGDHAMCEMLILRGADLAATGDAFFSKTPLHLACIEGHSGTVRVLCERRADVNALSGLLDKSPLHFACEHGHTECVRLLIQHKACINDCGAATNGNSPLHAAVEHGHWHVCDALLTLKANVYVQGQYSTMGTPLHTAARQNQILIARLLLDHDTTHAPSDTSQQTENRLTIVDTTFNTPLTQLLAIENKNNNKSTTPHTPLRLCDVPDAQGHTALHVSCMKAHYELAALLIAEGTAHDTLSLAGKRALDLCPLSHTDILAREALQIACNQADAQRAEAERERDFRRRVEEAREREHLRVEKEEKERLAREERERESRTRKFLLALWRCVCVSGEAVALRAIANEFSSESVDVYLPERESDIGSDSDAESESGRESAAALREKARRRRTASLEALSAATTETTTALVTHTQNSSPIGTGSDQLVVYDEKRDKKEKYEENAYFTPLTRASQRGLPELVAEILRWPSGCAVNMQERVTGCTALHRAAQSQSRECCEALLYARCVVSVSDRSGRVAANYAESAGLRELLRNPQYLLEQVRWRESLSTEMCVRREKALSEKTLSVRDVVSEGVRLSEAQVKVTETPSQALALTHTNSQSHTRFPALSPTRPHSQSPARASSSVSLPVLCVQSQALSLLKGAHTLIGPHGELPQSFGGCRVDVCALSSLSGEEENTPSHHAQTDTQTQTALRTQSTESPESERESEREIIFLDVFSLQRSYTPSVCDGDEWLAAKDFLWLLSQPYRDTHRETIQDAATIDKRAIVFLISIAMDELQRVYVTPPHKLSHTHHKALARYLPPSDTEEERERERRELPKNLSLSDVTRLRVFADTCLTFLTQYLRLYDTQSIDCLASTHAHLSRAERLEYLHTHVVYLRDHCYIDWRTSERLERLITVCDLKRHEYAVPVFTNLREIVRERRKRERERKKALSLSRRNSSRSLSMEKETECEAERKEGDGAAKEVEEKEKREGDDEEEEEQAGFTDPLRSLWSELVLNPPRAMRVAMDCVYELARETQTQLESAFAQDAVRAHLWAHYGRLVLQTQCEEEREKTRKLKEHARVEEEERKLEERRREIARAAREAAEREASKKRFVSKFAKRATSSSMDEESNNPLDDNKPLNSGGESSFTFSLPPLTNASADEVQSIQASLSMSVPVSALQCWLQELHLLEYESFFANMGFRLLEDFEELNESDCYRYFPFLKVGDARRLAKHCDRLDDVVIKKYKKKAKKMSPVPLPDNNIDD